MVGRMIERGYDPTFAQRCFDQIKGFGSYGFPESHAASFAQLVYVSSWIKRHYPAAFACALLNSQPMGFYAPAQIVRDAREHGVEVRPVDVSYSGWDNSLEGSDRTPALRIGLLHTVVEADALDAAIERQIALLLKAGPVAAARAKQLVARVAATADRDRADRDNADLIARLRVSPEGQEGLSAFLDKRTPRWVED